MLIFSGDEPARAFSVCFSAFSCSARPVAVVIAVADLSFRACLSPSRLIKLRFMPLFCPLVLSGGRSPSP